MFGNYYKDKDGMYYSEHDVEKAYYITTGKTRREDEQEYLCWVDSIWGKAIVASYDGKDIAINKDLAMKQPVLATKLYRQHHGCSLREAYEVISQFAKKQEKLKTCYII